MMAGSGQGQRLPGEEEEESRSDTGEDSLDQAEEARSRRAAPWRFPAALKLRRLAGSRGRSRCKRIRKKKRKGDPDKDQAVSSLVPGA